MTDFTRTRSLFHLPEGIIYLDGNSLGPLPLASHKRIARLLRDEWGEMLIRGWNDAGWMDQPGRLGDRIGRLIGAPSGTVVMGDTLSIKVYQAVAAALEMQPERKVILSDHGNFPSDLYMVDGLIRSLDRGHEIRLAAPEDVAGALDENVAVLMLTEIDYRTGRKHDMARLTAAAHAAGALTVWDLAHSVGALPIDVAGAGADFAVGCTYKFLNAGPGAPAFIYVSPEHFDRIRPALSGWLGHESPFAFDLEYRSGRGIERMRVGTPPIIAFAALDAALDVWDDVAIEDVRAQSMELERAVHRGGGEALPGPGSRQSPVGRGPRLASVVPVRARVSRHAGPHRPGRHRRLPRPGRHAVRDCAALSGCRGHGPGGGDSGRNRDRAALGSASVPGTSGGDLTCGNS